MNLQGEIIKHRKKEIRIGPIESITCAKNLEGITSRGLVDTLVYETTSKSSGRVIG